MPALSRRNGYFRSQLQALYLWLSGEPEQRCWPRCFHDIDLLDMPVLLASHQGKLERTVPRLSTGLHRRCRAIQAHRQRRVRGAHSSPPVVPRESRRILTRFADTHAVQSQAPDPAEETKGARTQGSRSPGSPAAFQCPGRSAKRCLRCWHRAQIRQRRGALMCHCVEIKQ